MEIIYSKTSNIVETRHVWCTLKRMTLTWKWQKALVRRPIIIRLPYSTQLAHTQFFTEWSKVVLNAHAFTIKCLFRDIKNDFVSTSNSNLWHQNNFCDITKLNIFDITKLFSSYQNSILWYQKLDFVTHASNFMVSTIRAYFVMSQNGEFMETRQPHKTIPKDFKNATLASIYISFRRQHISNYWYLNWQVWYLACIRYQNQNVLADGYRHVE